MNSKSTSQENARPDTAKSHRHDLRAAANAVSSMAMVMGVSAVLLLALKLVLARLSPVALAGFVTLDLYVKLVASLLLFGGPIVLGNYVAKASSKDEERVVIVAHAIPVFAGVALAITVLLAFPQALDYLLGRSLDGALRWCLLALTPIIAANRFLACVQFGFNRMKRCAIMENIHVWVAASACILLLPVWRSAGDRRIFEGLLIAICAGSVLSLVMVGIPLVRQLRGRIPKFSIPRGFWMFTLSTQLGLVLLFLWNNLDRLLVLSRFSLADLGVYEVLLTCFLTTRLLPQLGLRAVIPSLSVMVAESRFDAVTAAARGLVRYVSLLVFMPTALFAVFGRQILLAFGSTYVTPQNMNLLALVLLTPVLTALGPVVAPLMTSFEKRHYILLNSLGIVCIQLVLSLMLIRPFGMGGILVAKLVGTLAGQVFPWIYGFRVLPLGVKFPVRLMVVGEVLVAVSLMISQFQHGNLWLCLACYTLVVAAYLVLNEFTITEFRRQAIALLNHQTSAEIEPLKEGTV